MRWSLQSDHRDAIERKTPLTSSHPRPLVAAPNRVTGSLVDHIASRGCGSPLWSARSSVTSRGWISARKSSTSVMAASKGRGLVSAGTGQVTAERRG